MATEHTVTIEPAALAEGDVERFDIGLALALAEHAIAAYLEPAAYDRAVEAVGFHSGTVEEEGEAQVAIAWHPEAIVVAPRGSSEPEDWLDDFASVFKMGWSPPLPRRHTFTADSGRERTRRPRIGAGFRDQVSKISPKLRRRVTEARELYPSAPISVTGHSLGGALVPLVVTALADYGLESRVAYAFESPRPGNAAFAAWYADRFDHGQIAFSDGRRIFQEIEAGRGSHLAFRRQITPTYSVVNVVKGEPDIVTRFPRRYWGFRHLGRRVVLAGEEVLFGDAAWQDYRRRHPVQGWRIFTRLARSVRAHLSRQLLVALRARASA